MKQRRQTEFGHLLTADRRSSFAKYRQLVVGDGSLWELVRYELVMTFAAPIPGAVGYGLRKVAFPCMLGRVGRGTAFGRNMMIRNPSKISIGRQVVVDDNVVLDAKGANTGRITIGDEVVISRNNILSCKGGYITIGNHTNIAQNCLIHSEERVEIGDEVIIAAYTYIVGGGNHDYSRLDVPIIEQPNLHKGGIVIEDNVWIGARVTILDGVTVHTGSVIGAGAVVTEDVPENCVVAGIPAKVVAERS